MRPEPLEIGGVTWIPSNFILKAKHEVVTILTVDTPEGVVTACFANTDIMAKDGIYYARKGSAPRWIDGLPEACNLARQK